VNWDSAKEKELERLFKQFAGFMTAQVRKYRVGRIGVEVDDVLQEIRVKLWKALRNEKNIHYYASYIKKIVDTSVIDFFRKFKREEGVYLYEKSLRIAELDRGYDADYIRENMDVKDIVGLAVERLIPSRRNIVRLYLLNMTIDEIALHYRYSLSKTRNLLYRGLKDLRKILVEKSIDDASRP
jgi:RNA polymerase sigma factor (sigma-70 family)